MNITKIASAFVSLTALRIYIFFIVLLSAWNLYQLLSIPFAVLAQTGFTPIDYALYFASALSMLTTVLGFAYIAYTPKTLATSEQNILHWILGIIAGTWVIADLFSTIIYATSEPAEGISYWYQVINGLLMSFINPTIICGLVLYILYRYAGNGNARKVGMIVLWSMAAWVFLITLRVIIGAMNPLPVETA